jgi:hypothetical protein
MRAVSARARPQQERSARGSHRAWRSPPRRLRREELPARTQRDPGARTTTKRARATSRSRSASSVALPLPSLMACVSACRTPSAPAAAQTQQRVHTCVRPENEPFVCAASMASCARVSSHVGQRRCASSPHREVAQRLRTVLLGRGLGRRRRVGGRLVPFVLRHHDHACTATASP